MKRTLGGLLLALTLAACSQSDSPPTSEITPTNTSATAPNLAGSMPVLKPLDIVLATTATTNNVVASLKGTIKEVDVGTALDVFYTIFEDRAYDGVSYPDGADTGPNKDNPRCNAVSDNPVTITINTHSNVQITSTNLISTPSNSIQFTSCNLSKKVTLTSNVAGDYPITITTSGGRGNGTVYGTTAQFTLKVKTSTAPIVQPTISGMPSNQTAEARSSDGAAVSYAQPTATQNTQPVAVNCTMPGPDATSIFVNGGGTFPLGTTTVTCTAGSTNETFTVTVRDTTGPVITAPNVGPIQATGAMTAVNFAPSATDLVDGSRAVSCDKLSGSTF
ncbi:hypothetical protein, partial [Deinococcus malanensis]|uniref:hypothetical protein n=1 Tax=Deinococcus malanensis TaxID=1706855 RepID=UPI001E3B9B9A